MIRGSTFRLGIYFSARRFVQSFHIDFSMFAYQINRNTYFDTHPDPGEHTPSRMVNRPRVDLLAMPAIFWRHHSVLNNSCHDRHLGWCISVISNRCQWQHHPNELIYSTHIHIRIHIHIHIHMHIHTYAYTYIRKHIKIHTTYTHTPTHTPIYTYTYRYTYTYT